MDLEGDKKKNTQLLGYKNSELYIDRKGMLDRWNEFKQNISTCTHIKYIKKESKVRDGDLVIKQLKQTPREINENHVVESGDGTQ